MKSWTAFCFITISKRLFVVFNIHVPYLFGYDSKHLTYKIGLIIKQIKPKHLAIS